MNLAEHKLKVETMLLTTFGNHSIKELTFKDIAYFDTDPDDPSVFLKYEFVLTVRCEEDREVKEMLKDIRGRISVALTAKSVTTMEISPLKS